MVLFLAVQVFSVLALGPQVVSTSSGNVTFQFSEIKECEPVSITLVGNYKPRTIPMWLTLVPFSSTPFSIPITNITSDFSSIYVTFVPFAADTRFIASLDDANGNNVAEVSDILQVLPSPTGNVTCLPTSVGTMNYYVVNTSNFSQCENFTLQYNTTVISHAPTVRLFNPKGSSLLLNLTSDDNKTGTATYLLSFDWSKKVVLVFDDGSDHKASSAIMTVSGDTSSPVDCLTTTSLNGIESNSDASSVPTRISMPVVIGLSVGGGLMGLVAFCILLFILRKRRCRRGADPFNQIFTEKGQPSDPSEKQSLPTPTPSKEDQVQVKIPHYTKIKYTSGATMTSWSQPIPDDQQVPSRTSAAHDANDDANSLNSLDFEEMLHMTAVHSNRTSRQIAEPISLGPAIPSEPTSPLYLSSNLSRQYMHDPSDVPLGHPSMASAISLTPVVDPFANDAFNRQEQVSLILSRQNFAMARVQSVLPTSPRYGFHLKRERSSEVSGVPEDVRLSSTSILVEHR